VARRALSGEGGGGLEDLRAMFEGR
jgi:hypothetical protein